MQCELPAACCCTCCWTPCLAAEPFEHWFNIHEYAPLIIFFAVYLGIVRNKKISHVARYHAMMVGGQTSARCRHPGGGCAPCRPARMGRRARALGRCTA